MRKLALFLFVTILAGALYWGLFNFPQLFGIEPSSEAHLKILSIRESALFSVKRLIPGTEEHTFASGGTTSVITEERPNIFSQDSQQNQTPIEEVSLMNELYPLIQSYVNESFDFNKWQWRFDPIFATVLGVDSASGMLGLRILLPSNDSRFSNQNLALRVDCPVEKTLILSKEGLSIVAEKVPLFENIEVGDGLYSFCNDQGCTSLGRGCAVLKAK